MGKVEAATAWMERIAADNSHGYSQSVRWGPSYDCSSMVISAWEQAGVPVKSRGATYTGNMYSVFRLCGFEDVTKECNLQTGAGVIRGDVLLNQESHVAMSVGGGRVVHARSSEGTGDTADNSGNEIRVQSYWNYPWDVVLRLREAGTDAGTGNGTETDANAGTETGADGVSSAGGEITPTEVETSPVAQNELSYGDVGAAVAVLQAMLNYFGAEPELDVDGEFGIKTHRALIAYQGKRDIMADGICGIKTWGELMKND